MSGTAAELLQGSNVSSERSGMTGSERHHYFPHVFLIGTIMGFGKGSEDDWPRFDTLMCSEGTGFGVCWNYCWKKDAVE